jgi:glutaredoxin
LHTAIHLYTEPGCGACIEAKRFLKSRGISFEKRGARANLEYLRNLTEDFDSCTLPTPVIDGVVIPGFEREEYVQLPGHAANEKNGKQLMARRER